jgi:branched-chain amino acid transport system substrate-binding protein
MLGLIDYQEGHMFRRSLYLSRRTFLRGTALSAAASASLLHSPAVLRAQGAAVKIGVLHPVSGALSYSGQQGRVGATMAIDDINAAGGIKALGGAKIDPMLGDAQSTPDGGNAEVEKMNAAGVSAVVGGYASAICLSASQTAARYDLPYLVDVGVVDSIVTRGLKNTFRFGPGFGVIAKTALENLVTINDQAGKPAKTVMIVHEDSAFGAGLAKLLNAQLPDRGFQILETIPHPTPTREFESVVLKIKAQNPDLVIPANYYNEYVMLARTMQQQRVRPKGIYSVLGGAASSYKFVKEFPEAAQYIMDCNHWFDPKNAKALALKRRVEDKGQFYTYEVYMNYSCMLLLADALERAASTDRAKITDALANSTFGGHLMPYGPTKFTNGQNEGAAPVNTQVLGNDIQVILPAQFASAKPVFPIPPA